MKNKEMELVKKELESNLEKKYRMDTWNRFKDSISATIIMSLLIVLAIILVVGLLGLIFTLIEQPVSLSIIFLFIYMMWREINR